LGKRKSEDECKSHACADEVFCQVVHNEKFEKR
jgi:hypothetical protein